MKTDTFTRVAQESTLVPCKLLRIVDIFKRFPRILSQVHVKRHAQKTEGRKLHPRGMNFQHFYTWFFFNSTTTSISSTLRTLALPSLPSLVVVTADPPSEGFNSTSAHFFRLVPRMAEVSHFKICELSVGLYCRGRRISYFYYYSDHDGVSAAFFPFLFLFFSISTTATSSSPSTVYLLPQPQPQPPPPPPPTERGQAATTGGKRG